MHEVESFVDPIKRQDVGDQIVDINLAVHVPIDDLGNIGTAAGAPEGRALPYPARHQLERASPNLLPRTRNADDNRDAPTTVAALEGLAHQVDIAGALEAVIGASVGQVDKIGHEITLYLLGVDEMSHAELARERFARGVEVDTDNHVGAGHASALDDIEPDAAEPEHHDIGSRLDLGGVDHRADTGGDAAADVADLVKGCIFANLRQGDFREDGEVGEGRAAHVVIHGFAVEGESAGPVGHHALALRRANRSAKVGLARQARLALPAFGRIERNDVVALLDTRHAWAHVDHDAGALVTQDSRKEPFRIGAGTREFVGMADAGRFDLDQHFARLRSSQLHRFQHQGCPCAMSYRSTNIHRALL